MAEPENVKPVAEVPAIPPKPADAVPDGIGLTLEQVQRLLANAHKAVVDYHDPVLMVVTMLNAWLTEMEKLQARHESGLTRLMAEKTQAYVSGVQTAVNQLSDSLSSASVEGIRKIFDDHAACLKTFRSNVNLAALIVGISALLNVAVFVLKAVR